MTRIIFVLIYNIIIFILGTPFNIHHKLVISQNFNRIHAKFVKQYVCAKSMGFQM
jgi:hypothetical protein